MDYLFERYESSGSAIDCSGGCIIPIKLTSGVNQNITLKNLKVEYEKTSGISLEGDFYDLSEIPARIDSDYQQLYLDDAGFSVTDDLGEDTFTLSLNGDEIFSEDILIEISASIKNLKPLKTAAAVPTLFEVTVNNPSSGAFEVEIENSSVEVGNGIISYDWDFGDGDKRKTTQNTIVYTYGSVGVFNVTVTATDFDKYQYSKTFQVVVETPINAVRSLLKKKLDDLDNVKSEIGEYPDFQQDQMYSLLNLNEIDGKLKDLQTKEDSATTDQDYIEIMVELLGLEVPESVVTTKKGDSLSFFINKNKINLDVLEEVGGGEYSPSREDDYLDAIVFWNLENLDIKITFNELSAVYDFGTENLINVFTLKITEKNPLDYDSYIIIKDLEDLEFDKNYGEKRVSGYIQIPLSSGSNTLTFSTTEEVSFIELPVFISPAISDLSIPEEPIVPEEKLSKWVFFMLIMFFLFIEITMESLVLMN